MKNANQQHHQIINIISLEVLQVASHISTLF